MKKTALLLLLACGIATVFLWRSFRPAPPEIVAPAQAEKIGPTKSTRPAEDAAVRTHAVAPKQRTRVRTPTAEPHTKDEGPTLKLDRAATTPYPSEIDGSYKIRMELLDAFDAFVKEADLTDEEIAAVKTVVYDAQSGFGEISRRVYGGSLNNILKPKRPNWIDEASNDAERQRRELFSNIASIVGKERARLLPITFGTGLEVISHRLFLKPGQPAVNLRREKTYP